MIDPARAVLFWKPAAAPPNCHMSDIDDCWIAYLKHDGATRKQWRRLSTRMQLAALRVIGNLAIADGTDPADVERELAKVEGMQ